MSDGVKGPGGIPPARGPVPGGKFEPVSPTTAKTSQAAQGALGKAGPATAAGGSVAVGPQNPALRAALATVMQLITTAFTHIETSLRDDRGEVVRQRISAVVSRLREGVYYVGAHVEKAAADFCNTLGRALQHVTTLTEPRVILAALQDLNRALEAFPQEAGRRVATIGAEVFNNATAILARIQS